MKYLVVENQLSYSVVVDDEGHFYKVANLGYKVGQRIDEVVRFDEMRLETVASKKKRKGWYLGIAAVCAALVLTITIALFPQQKAYASVYLEMEDPQVRMDVEENGRVIRISGENEDGKRLIEGYLYEEKDLEQVTKDLLDRAIQEEMLQAGETILLQIRTDDDQWYEETMEQLKEGIQEHIGQAMQPEVEVSRQGQEAITVPTTTPASTQEPQKTSRPQPTGEDDEDEDDDDDEDDDEEEDKD